MPITPDRIIDGVPYIRSYVSELEEGDVNAFGQTVSFIQRLGEGTTIYYTDHTTAHYGKGDSTLLIELR